MRITVQAARGLLMVNELDEIGSGHDMMAQGEGPGCTDI